MMWLFDGDKEMPLQLNGSKTSPKIKHIQGGTSPFPPHSQPTASHVSSVYIPQEFPTPAPQAKRPKSWPRPKKWRYLGVVSRVAGEAKQIWWYCQPLDCYLNHCFSIQSLYFEIQLEGEAPRQSCQNYIILKNIENGTTTTQLNRNWFVLSSYYIVVFVLKKESNLEFTKFQDWKQSF